MRERAGIRHDAAGRDRALAQRPEETLVQRLALLGLLDVGQRPRDARKRVVHGRVDRGAVLGGQPVFPVPDVERRFLEGNFFDVFMLDSDHGAHFLGDPSPCFRPPFAFTENLTGMRAEGAA